MTKTIESVSMLIPRGGGREVRSYPDFLNVDSLDLCSNNLGFSNFAQVNGKKIK